MSFFKNKKNKETIAKGSAFSYQNVKDKELSKLQKIAKNGEFKKVKSFAKEITSEKSSHASGKCSSNRTAMHYACAFGHSEVARELLSFGAAADLLDSDNCSPLFRAIEGNHTDCYKMLLQQCSPYITFEMFELAIKKKNNSLFDMLIKTDFTNFEKTEEAKSLLHLAAAEGNLHVVKTLLNLELSLDINFADINGQSPVMVATIAGHVEVVKLLINSHADLHLRDKQDNNCLDYAADNSDCEEKIKDAINKDSGKSTKNRDGVGDEDTSWRSDSESVAAPKPSLVPKGDGKLVIDLNKYPGQSEIFIPGSSNNKGVRLKIPVVNDKRLRSRSPSPNVSRSMSPLGSSKGSDLEQEDELAKPSFLFQKPEIARPGLKSVPEQSVIKDDDDSDWSASVSVDIKEKPKLNLKQVALQAASGSPTKSPDKKLAAIPSADTLDLDDFDDDTVASELPVMTPRSGKGTPRDRKISLDNSESGWDSESELPAGGADTKGKEGKVLSKQESDWDDDTTVASEMPVATPRETLNLSHQMSESDWDSSMSQDIDTEKPQAVANDELKDTLQPIEEENSWKSDNSGKNEKEKKKAKPKKNRLQKDATKSQDDSDWDSSISEENPLAVTAVHKVNSKSPIKAPRSPKQPGAVDVNIESPKKAPRSPKKEEEVAVSPVNENEYLTIIESKPPATEADQRTFDGNDSYLGASGFKRPNERYYQARRELDSLRRSSGSIGGESDTTSLTGNTDKNKRDESEFLTPLGSYFQGVVGESDHPDLAAELETDGNVSDNSFSGKEEFSGKSRGDLMRSIRDLREKVTRLEFKLHDTEQTSEDALKLKKTIEDDVDSLQQQLKEEQDKSEALAVRIDNMHNQLRLRDEELHSEQSNVQKTELQLRSTTLELEAAKQTFERVQKELADLRQQFLHEQELRIQAEGDLKNLSEKQQESLQRSARDEDPSRELDDHYSQLKSSSSSNLSNELQTARTNYEDLRVKYQDERKQWFGEREELVEKQQDTEKSSRVIQEAMDKVTLQNAGLTAQCRNLEAALEAERHEAEKLRSKVSMLSDELAQLSDSTSQNEKNWNEWADKLEEREEKLRDLQNLNKDLQVHVKDAEDRVHLIEAEHKQAQQQLRERNSVLEDTKDKLQECLQELQEAQGEVHQLREQDASLRAKGEGLSAQLQTALDTNSTLKVQLEKLLESLNRGEDKNSDVQRRLYDILSMMRNDYDKSKVNLEKEKIGLQHEIQSLKNGGHGGHNQTATNGRESDSQLAALMERLEKAEAQKQVTNSKLASWKQDEYEDRIRHQEVKNTKLEMTLDNEKRKNRDLGKNILDFEEERNDRKIEVDKLTRAKEALHAKLKEEEKIRKDLHNELQQRSEVWEAEKEAMQKLNLRIAKLEKAREELSFKLEGEKLNNQKQELSKRHLESKLQQYQNKYGEFETELTALRSNLKFTKSRMKELGLADFDKERQLMDDALAAVRQQVQLLHSRLMLEDANKHQLEEENRSLHGDLLAVKSLEDAMNNLEMQKRKVEEEFQNYKIYVKTNYVLKSEMESKVGEVEAKARSDSEHKLQQVNRYLTEQSRIREELDSKLAETERRAQDERMQLQRLADRDSFVSRGSEKIPGFTSADELRRVCLDMASERDRFCQDSNHYKEMYNQEKRLRHKLAEDLERSMNSQAQTQAYLSLEKDRSRHLTGPSSGFLSSQSIPAMYTSQQSLYNAAPDPHLQQRLRSELDRSIAKHLESDDKFPNFSLAANRSKSIGNVSADLDFTYLTYLKKKYLV